jgi:hypothetical protein
MTTQSLPIPVGVSNRHIHVSQADLDTLFGQGYQLTIKKDLGQPGQFAAEETVDVQGPKNAINKIHLQIHLLWGLRLQFAIPAHWLDHQALLSRGRKGKLSLKRALSQQSVTSIALLNKRFNWV